jgi:rhodanese-related sulfurtransferase
MSMASSSPAAPRTASEISHEELARRFRDPSLAVIDVLPHESYEGGHIPGAHSLPLAELASRASAILPNFTQEIVAYCASPT